MTFEFDFAFDFLLLKYSEDKSVVNYLVLVYSKFLLFLLSIYSSGFYFCFSILIGWIDNRAGKVLAVRL